MSAVESYALWELAAGPAVVPPTCAVSSELTDAEIKLAARALTSLQAITGSPRFARTYQWPKGSKDDRPLILRRVWLYALAQVRENGRPLFSSRKLAGITRLNERSVRDDCAMVEGWLLGDGLLPGLIEHCVEQVHSAIVFGKSAALFYELAGAALAKDREANREARKPRVVVDNRTAFQIEIDTLRESAEQRRKADYAEYQGRFRKEQEATHARIDAAVAARRAQEAEAKAARRQRAA